MTKTRLLLSRMTSPPNRLGKRTRRFSRSSLPLKDIKLRSLSLNSSACSLGSSNVPFHSGDTNTIISDVGVNSKSSVQNLDLELDFQSLRLGEGQTVDIEGCSSSTVYDSTPEGEGVCTFVAGNPCVPGSSQHSEDLITRLRRALAVETHARQQAEHHHLQEMKRRIEMEEIVAQLQREREELTRQLSVTQPPPPSSPVLLSSSPCASSRVLITPTLSALR